MNDEVKQQRPLATQVTSTMAVGANASINASAGDFFFSFGSSFMQSLNKTQAGWA
ncbi:MAG TPA: hypothetical protein VFA77_14680 [Candidatus Eisenbacteria bacterium]|nr:hypothetical protein [Candidatus Eisenbacteria bacterium]